jgi:hypothetical protein
MSKTPPRRERPFSVHAIHLVRTAIQANLTLSQMADQKASLLMGATFVVFTIAVGQAARGPVPLTLLVLAGFAFLSACCAVAAVLPSVRATSPAADGRRNLLFFGVFTQLDEDQFVEEVLDQLHADETVFRTMLRDVYQNGQVLQRKKYRLLGWAYRLFVGGLVLTVVTFALERGDLL